MPSLFIFAGLPGSGKTTLSRLLAQHFEAVHLRIDTIEQALRDLCGIDVVGEGYEVAYRIAADNLVLGLNVVADSCNPVGITRKEWKDVATRNHADFVNIEVICSDAEEHQRRIENRVADIPTLRPPTWQDVKNREYDVWSEDRIIVDTANCSIDASLAALLKSLGKETEKRDEPKAAKRRKPCD